MRRVLRAANKLKKVQESGIQTSALIVGKQKTGHYSLEFRFLVVDERDSEYLLTRDMLVNESTFMRYPVGSIMQIKYLKEDFARTRWNVYFVLSEQLNRSSTSCAYAAYIFSLLVGLALLVFLLYIADWLDGWIATLAAALISVVALFLVRLVYRYLCPSTRISGQQVSPQEKEKFENDVKNASAFTVETKADLMNQPLLQQYTYT